MAKPNLFVIDDEIDQVAQAFDLYEEEGEPETLATIEEYFGKLIDDRDRKLDNYAGLIRSWETMAKARKEEANRIARLAEIDLNKVKRAKDRLKLWMDSKGISKIETNYNKFAIQANGGVCPLEIDPEYREDPAKLPEIYQKKTISPDTEAIRADLDAGGELSFARLGERGSHLRIR